MGHPLLSEVFEMNDTDSREVEESGSVVLPPSSIEKALRASHERLVSEELVPGDPDYPFPEEDYLSFALIRLGNAWKSVRERADWTVPEPVEQTTETEFVGPTSPSQVTLGDYA